MREGGVKIRKERGQGVGGEGQIMQDVVGFVKILDFILSEDLELKGGLNQLCFKSIDEVGRSLFRNEIGEGFLEIWVYRQCRSKVSSRAELEVVSGYLKE